MNLGEAHDVLERLCLSLQVAALKADESVRQRVVLVLAVHVLLYYLHEVGQRHHGATHHEVVLRLLFFARKLFSHHVLQSDSLRHLVHHANLLARAVDELELAIGEHNGERNAREAAARAEVEHLSAFAEANLMSDGERVEHVMLVEVVHILARDDVNLAVPVLVESLQCSELLALSVAQIREVFQYQFHFPIVRCMFFVVFCLVHYASRRFFAVFSLYGASVLLTELAVDVSQFASAEDIVVVHIVHVDAFAVAVAESAERFFHNLHTLVYGSVLYK